MRFKPTAKNVILHEKKQAIFFFGESGIGKTTLMNEIVKRKKEYFLPRLSTTRNPRKDDNPKQFTYLTEKAFTSKIMKNEFIYFVGQGKKMYGVQRKELNDKRIPLLYGSPLQKEILELKLTKILIEGPSIIGLFLRNEEGDKIASYIATNRKLRKKYFSKKTFRKKMSLIVKNEFYSKKAFYLKLESLLKKRGAKK